MKGCLTQHAPTGLGDGREHYKRLITFTFDKQICLLLIFFFRRKCENWIAKFQNEINSLRGWKNSTRCPVVELDRM